MSDVNAFKPIWTNPPVPADVGVSGDLITSRGTDPLIDTTGENGLTQVVWPNPPVGATGTEETANSVSGLPSTPNRFEPSPASPPAPPTLTERSPTTIDEQ